jgi:hypothetical protein
MYSPEFDLTPLAKVRVVGNQGTLDISPSHFSMQEHI